MTVKILQLTLAIIAILGQGIIPALWCYAFIANHQPPPPMMAGPYQPPPVPDYFEIVFVIWNVLAAGILNIVAPASISPVIGPGATVYSVVSVFLLCHATCFLWHIVRNSTLTPGAKGLWGATYIIGVGLFLPLPTVLYGWTNILTSPKTG